MAKRESTRFSYFELIDRYDMNGKDLIERGRILDISEKGVLYKGNIPMNVGERYKFKFEVGGDYFFIEGEVIRVTQHPVDRKALSGVKLFFAPLQAERLNRNLLRAGKKPVL